MLRISLNAGAHQVLRFVDDHGGVVRARRVPFASEKRRCVAVGVVHFLDPVLRQLRPVLCEDGPDLGPGAAAEPCAPARPEDAQVLFLGPDAGGLDDVLPFLGVEGVGVVQGEVPKSHGALPRGPCVLVPVLVVGDLELVPLAAQERDHPSVQVGHLDPLHLLGRADRTQVVLDVGGQVAGKGDEEDALACAVRSVSAGVAVAVRVRHPPSQPARPVHSHDGLARACAAQHANGTVPPSLHQPALRRMQEDPPLLQRRVEHLLEGGIVVPPRTNRARDSLRPRAASKSLVSTGSLVASRSRISLS